MSDYTESHSADTVADETYLTQSNETVPPTRDTDSLCTTAVDSEDWFTEVKQEVSEEQIKQEPDDVCYYRNKLRTVCMTMALYLF